MVGRRVGLDDERVALRVTIALLEERGIYSSELKGARIQLEAVDSKIALAREAKVALGKMK